MLPLLLLLLVALSGGVEPRFCFPIEKETKAFQILEDDFFSVLRYENVEVPESCPFHRIHDRHLQARYSREVHMGVYRCSFCSSEFPNTAGLEDHIRSSHANGISSAHSKCYMDYCDMLGCDDHHSLTLAPFSKSERDTKLHWCKQVLNSCFDRNKPKGRELLDMFSKKFCGRFLEKAELVAPARHTAWDKYRVLKYLGIGFLVLILLVFYVLIFIWKSENASSPDIAWPGLMGRIKQTVMHPKKVKGY